MRYMCCQKSFTLTSSGSNRCFANVSLDGVATCNFEANFKEKNELDKTCVMSKDSCYWLKVKS